jgi:quercetin dioxygenase-like cupin family protein
MLHLWLEGHSMPRSGLGTVPTRRSLLCTCGGLVAAGALAHPHAVSAAAAMQSLPEGVYAVTPDRLTFSESPRAPGVLTAPLLGAPSKAEYYVFRAKYPANTVNGPHHHPGDEELTVIAGTLYLGHGSAMDRDAAMAYPPGSYIREPAGAVHYLFTKDEIVELEIRGMGPRKNIYLK